MTAANPIAHALPEIERAFSSAGKRVFTAADLRRIFTENRDTWELSETTLHQFQKAVKNIPTLKEVRFDFPYRPVYRFVWNEVTTFELVQSINDSSYFSHYTALYLHGLTEQIPKTIYFNTEQPNKAGGGILTQAGIDRAFKGKCRTSTNIARYKDRSICLINGANTGHLGVVSMMSPEGETEIRVTNLERSLIDAAVRPVYAGGVFEVRKAFEAARGLASSNKLAAYLRKLHYSYPYHQSIGFLMERAGFNEDQLALMREFGIEYEFYLDYGLKETMYVDKWRLHVPKGF